MQTIQKKKNNTGLPDNLKTGIENLSGYSMNDVKVHRNSDKPAQLQAQAYAQGTDIHLGPGQEKHLPHEAWHVVQQKQGRVKPTMQLKGMLNINDDNALEHEADLMGAKVAQMKTSTPELTELTEKHITSPTIQGFDLTATTFAELITEQNDNQTTFGYSKEDYSGITTVGFEHEFAQMDTGSIKGLTHLVLSASTKKLPLSNLPFYLETDADNALELVSPPFLVNTINDTTPIPDPKEVKQIDDMIQSSLSSMVAKKPKLSALIQDFKKDPELTFPISEVTTKPENVSPTYDGSFNKDEDKVSASNINDIDLKPSRKAGLDRPGISAQVNFATDAEHYGSMLNLSTDEEYEPQKAYADLQTRLQGLINDVASAKNIVMTPELKLYLQLMAKTLSTLLALPSITKTKTTKEEIFDNTNEHTRKAKVKKIHSGQEKEEYEHASSMASHVKDVSGAWIKDTLWNIGLGILTKDEWIKVKIITDITSNLGTKVKALKANGTLFGKSSKKFYSEAFDATMIKIDSAITVIHNNATTTITSPALSGSGKGGTKAEDIYKGPNTSVEFLGHDDQWVGTRQDTYIPDTEHKVQLPAWGKRLHVVETRGEPLDSLEMLKAYHQILNSNKSDAAIGQELHSITQTQVHNDREKHEGWLKEKDNTSNPKSLKDDELLTALNKAFEKQVAALRDRLIKKDLASGTLVLATAVKFHTTQERVNGLK
ncbi:eCIS core domain-containing protein [Nitrosomonas supralitoralis]|uniref:eCIS core domain-containing protein n=1 Tax=Nitrosomonas supralitoralis TaxID=2116706 RepID=UPI0018D5986B|nr:DUF4157 domain-containing protein [Nitrosomonas supralitoralis]